MGDYHLLNSAWVGFQGDCHLNKSPKSVLHFSCIGEIHYSAEYDADTLNFTFSVVAEEEKKKKNTDLSRSA